MRGATRLLHDILDDLEGGQPASAQSEKPDATLGGVLDRMDERGFGVLLLLLALPCCLPFVYVLPQIVALPMLALCAQLAAGRTHPWLPAQFRNRTLSIAQFRNVVTRGSKYGGWIERLARPRFKPVTGHLGGRLVGLLLLIPSASILVPLPSTNTTPGIGVAIVALGMIERDGLLVVLGLLIGIAWVALLIFLGAEAVQFIKDWLTTSL